jgi:hypothetical protein
MSNSQGSFDLSGGNVGAVVEISMLHVEFFPSGGVRNGP